MVVFTLPSDIAASEWLLVVDISTSPLAGVGRQAPIFTLKVRRPMGRSEFKALLSFHARNADFSERRWISGLPRSPTSIVIQFCNFSALAVFC
jgi:hypothetical protein